MDSTTSTTHRHGFDCPETLEHAARHAGLVDPKADFDRWIAEREHDARHSDEVAA